jgi:hypothetical protein
MPNRLDYRHHPEAQELLRKLPEMRYAPMAGATDLREIVRVFEGLPDLEYPIESAGELVEKLGGGEKALRMAGMEVDVLLILKRMPAYYFPIASVENFVEKMAELLRANRKTTDVPAELGLLKRQLPKLRFPIENEQQLIKSLEGTKSVVFRGRVIEARDALGRVHGRGLFPIRSEEDFDRKVAVLMGTRELVVKD